MGVITMPTLPPLAQEPRQEPGERPERRPECQRGPTPASNELSGQKKGVKLEPARRVGAVSSGLGCKR